MKKVLSYLKFYSIPFFICLLLLFVEAISDLSLPNLMSDIVNVGIQQSGVERPTPEAISEKDLNLLRPFMTADEKKLVEQNYSLIEKGKTADKAHNKTFSSIGQQNIYVLNSKFTKLNGETQDELNKAFSTSTVSMLAFLQDAYAAMNKETEEEPKTKESITAGELDNFDFKELYLSFQPIIDKLAQEEENIEVYRAKANLYDDMIRDQITVQIVGKLYSNIGANADSMRNAYLWGTGSKMIIITLIGAFATILVSYFASRIGTGIANRLRNDIFTKIESFASGEMDKFSTASLITRTTNDVTQVQNVLIMLLRFGFYSPIVAVGGMLLALEKSTSMSWIIAICVLILLLVLITIFIVAMPKFKSLQRIIDRLNLVTRERLTGLQVTRAFGNQEFEEKRFEVASRDISRVFLFINRLMVILMPFMNIVLGGLSLTIMFVGARQIENSQLQIGDMLAFSQYAMQIVFSFIMIASIFFMVPRASVSAGRIAEVLNTELTLKDTENPTKVPENIKGYVEFKNVSFRYGEAEEDVLHNISFVANPGETTAFIGSTGSGKSTLINLIPRFYDVSDGEILIDGINIRDLTQKDLRSIIGYIPQKGVLFSGDITSNLQYGKKNATQEEMLTAAKIAQAAEFVEQSEDGLNRAISQGGTNVSGGQRQRLSIARALVKNASIYIFDDSFSALDFKTDSMLRKSLKENVADATMLIVAQRVGTIINAEQIIVLNEGEIVGMGTHKTLLKNCDVYKEIAQSQLTKEELEQ